MKLDSYGYPEMALLMASSSGHPSVETVRRLVSGRLDWSLLTRLAVEAHATPGLWEVVSALPNLPAEAQVLQSLAVVNEFRQYHIRSLTARVTRELAREGIDVLVLKGAALLAGGIARPAQRTMSDIDMLVLNGKPEAAWRICRANGWTLVDEAWTEDLYRAHHHLAPLLDPDGVNVGLELHRSLMPGIARLGVDVSAIVARSRIVMVGDVPVRVPSVEDLLLHTCLHFAWANKLRRGAWRAYADAHAILADPSFDWDKFLALQASKQARQSCYWTLRLGREMADLDVPNEALRRLDPSSGGRLATLLERHFITQIADPGAEKLVAQRTSRWLWLAAMKEPAYTVEAAQLWNEGAVEVPGESANPRPPRGPVGVATTTFGYFLKLILRA